MAEVVLGIEHLHSHGIGAPRSESGQPPTLGPHVPGVWIRISLSTTVAQVTSSAVGVSEGLLV